MRAYACLPNSGDKALAKQIASASVSWTWQRRHHTGIEAAIGNLQDHRGCRRCPDKGKDGYDRFLQTADLAHNLLTYGCLLCAQDDPTDLPGETESALLAYLRQTPRIVAIGLHKTFITIVYFIADKLDFGISRYPSATDQG